MPKINEQGFGQTTSDKEEGLRKFYEKHMSIVKNICNKGIKIRPIYFDCTSGMGINPDCDGSPLILINTAEKIGLPCRIVLIEQDRATFDVLRQTISTLQENSKLSYASCTLICGDYTKKLYDIWKSVPDDSYMNVGMVYIDPTGLPEINPLAQFARFYTARKMDFLLHCSATTVKRVRNSYPDSHSCDTLDHYKSTLNKKHWIIRDSIGWDRHQHIFLFGTNMPDYNEMTKLRWHSTETITGKNAEARAKLTTDEYKNSNYCKSTLEGWGFK